MSSVRRMDRLVVLERGAIVEQGTHDVLVASDGIYASLWAHQSGGFLGTGLTQLELVSRDDLPS